MVTTTSSQLKWDKRYLSLAKDIAQWSLDPSSKIGAVAVGSKRQILAQGYNGFPRGVSDTEGRLNNRETKYRYVVHAEMNVIYNATYNGVSLDGSTIYIHGINLCGECAKGIIQVGISRVVMPINLMTKTWADSWEFSASLLDEANVSYDFIKMD